MGLDAVPGKKLLAENPQPKPQHPQQPAVDCQQLPAAEVPKMKVRHDSEAIKEGEASPKIGRFRVANVLCG